MNKTLLDEARATDGHFSDADAESLMAFAGESRNVLEVGCYKGRSTLFGLAALPDDGRWVSVDPFIPFCLCKGHSIATMSAKALADPRFLLVPKTLPEAAPLIGHRAPFDLVLIDGDHSFQWVAQDAALSVRLSAVGSEILFHDYHRGADFPGIKLVVEGLVGCGVLELIGVSGSIAACRVASRPAWLCMPGHFNGEQLAD